MSHRNPFFGRGRARVSSRGNYQHRGSSRPRNHPPVPIPRASTRSDEIRALVPTAPQPSRIFLRIQWFSGAVVDVPEFQVFSADGTFMLLPEYMPWGCDGQVCRIPLVGLPTDAPPTFSVVNGTQVLSMTLPEHPNAQLLRGVALQMVPPPTGPPGGPPVRLQIPQPPNACQYSAASGENTDSPA